jgi:hypothetical protein
MQWETYYDGDVQVRDDDCNGDGGSGGGSVGGGGGGGSGGGADVVNLEDERDGNDDGGGMYVYTLLKDLEAPRGMPFVFAHKFQEANKGKEMLHTLTLALDMKYRPPADMITGAMVAVVSAANTTEFANRILVVLEQLASRDPTFMNDVLPSIADWQRAWCCGNRQRMVDELAQQQTWRRRLELAEFAVLAIVLAASVVYAPGSALPASSLSSPPPSPSSWSSSLSSSSLLSSSLSSFLLSWPARLAACLPNLGPSYLSVICNLLHCPTLGEEPELLFQPLEKLEEARSAADANKALQAFLAPTSRRSALCGLIATVLRCRKLVLSGTGGSHAKMRGFAVPARRCISTSLAVLKYVLRRKRRKACGAADKAAGGVGREAGRGRMRVHVTCTVTCRWLCASVKLWCGYALPTVRPSVRACVPDSCCFARMLGVLGTGWSARRACIPRTRLTRCGTGFFSA